MTEAEIEDAIVALVAHDQVVAEGSGAVGVAALRSGRLRLADGRPAAVVITGANIDAGVLARLLDPALTAVRGDAWFAGALAALAVLAGARPRRRRGGPRGSALGGALGLGVGAVLLARPHRSRRRSATACGTPPSPTQWRRILEERYDHYHRLPPDLRRRFEERRARSSWPRSASPASGWRPTDELRLLVAASAATLSVGWEGDDWDQLAEVLLYPQDFDRDYAFDEDELSGQAHPWGTVILSVPTLRGELRRSRRRLPRRASTSSRTCSTSSRPTSTACPRGLDAARSREWLDVVDKRWTACGGASPSSIPTAAESPAEFLAVAVETFFEQPAGPAPAPPRGLRDPARLLRQDPAAWDERAG